MRMRAMKKQLGLVCKLEYSKLIPGGGKGMENDCDVLAGTYIQARRSQADRGRCASDTVTNGKVNTYSTTETIRDMVRREGTSFIVQRRSLASFGNLKKHDRSRGESGIISELVPKGRSERAYH